METLHLSYVEVWDGLPYRNMVIMSKDKMRPLYGGRHVMYEQDESEFWKDRI